MSRWCVGVIVWGALVLPAADAVAQRNPTPPTASPRGRTIVDAWLVTRFHDVQLLDDSVSIAPPAVRPLRVESTRDGDRVDTLFATQLGVGRDIAAYRVGARLRLGASSGSIANIPATVLARRFFRTPIRPMSARPDSAWRYGWAYLVTTAAVNAKIGAVTYRGWLLFATPDSARRGANPPIRESR